VGDNGTMGQRPLPCEATPHHAPRTSLSAGDIFEQIEADFILLVEFEAEALLVFIAHLIVERLDDFGVVESFRGQIEELLSHIAEVSWC